MFGAQKASKLQNSKFNETVIPDIASTTTPSGSYVNSTNNILSVEEVMCDLPARQGEADRHFVVRATVSGDSIDSLVDTGATISACKIERAIAWARNGFEITNLKIPLLVQLADGSTVKVTRFIKVKICIAEMTTEVTLHLMALPPGFDVLLGMD
mgnify:FL=1